jgi:hypothetical protein
MWLSISLRLRLSEPLAIILDRVFVDIAFHHFQKGSGNRCGDNSLIDAFRSVAASFEGFSRLPAGTTLSQNFRSAPVCFAPLPYWPDALYAAADLGAGFAGRIGKLLEERLGLETGPPVSGTVREGFDNSGFAARVEQLTAHTGELLCSGDLAMAVLAHRMLLRAQALCDLLARFRQLRVLAPSGLSTPVAVLTEPTVR